MSRIKMRGCEGEEEEGARGMRDGRNLEKTQGSNGELRGY